MKLTVDYQRVLGHLCLGIPENLQIDNELSYYGSRRYPRHPCGLKNRNSCLGFYALTVNSQDYGGHEICLSFVRFSLAHESVVKSWSNGPPWGECPRNF
jgi:hypothetical protein